MVHAGASRADRQITGLPIKVHQTVYCECLADELRGAPISFQREGVVPIVYRGRTLPLGAGADIVVDGRILIESKALSAILPVHETRLLTYLPLSQIRVGLLMNFRP